MLSKIITRTIQPFSSSSNVGLHLNSQNNSVQVTLTNPKKRNPLSHETLKQLYEKLIQVQKYAITGKARVMILKSEGPVFSAGHDLKELKDSKNPKQIFEDCANLMLRLRSISIPTICAVNGVAVAAGCQLSLACDMLLATEKSEFGCPGIKWGLFCSTPGIELVRSINSQKKANEMLFFGENISAKQAFQYGLVNKLSADEDEQNKQIEDYISKANNLSTEVLMLGKAKLNKQRTQMVEEAYKTANETMHQNITEVSDCREGLNAFAEKRKPKFKN